GKSFKAIGNFARDRRAFKAGDLLEVSELAHFHAVAPAFPTETPGAKRRAFPVVFDEADVVDRGIEADGGEGVEIELLDVVRRRFEDNLELIIVLQTVRILPVATVIWPARRLHIGGFPRLWAEGAE